MKARCYGRSIVEVYDCGNRDAIRIAIGTPWEVVKDIIDTWREKKVYPQARTNLVDDGIEILEPVGPFSEEHRDGLSLIAIVRPFSFEYLEDGGFWDGADSLNDSSASFGGWPRRK